jgi:hypothetical protein
MAPQCARWIHMTISLSMLVKQVQEGAMVILEEYFPSWDGSKVLSWWLEWGLVLKSWVVDLLSSLAEA